ncbi:MAG: hypothetical protein H6859_00580 [Rhodospirillales bacterium]|nr:hypothetical protein [Alphaproteobacteria bacterium]USO05734.1 MAG: hypothetical protein H6859_00580 [Rhodospirillales bacterium]
MNAMIRPSAKPGLFQTSWATPIGMAASNAPGLMRGARRLRLKSKMCFTLIVEKLTKVSYILLYSPIRAFELKGFNRGKFIMG